MKNPGIHITKHQFEKILRKLKITKFPVEDFFVEAKKVALVSRAVVNSQAKIRKKIEKVELASTGDAHLASDILLAVQRELKIRGAVKVTEGSKGWLQIKQLADICNTFCNDFNLDRREGYITYMKWGFKRMKETGGSYRNSLQRLVSYSSNISEAYASWKESLRDTDPRRTLAVHNYYCKIIADRTGLKVNYENSADYVFFKRVRESCDTKLYDYREWIDAQFEGLAWCNGIPEPSKLIGDKANEYFMKFKYKYNLTKDSQPKVEGSLWSKIKSE